MADRRRILRSAPGLLAGLLVAVSLGSLPANASVVDLYRRAEAALDAWHPERAEPLVRELMDEAGDGNPMAHLAASRLRFHQGRYDEAVEHMTRVRELAGEVPSYAGFAGLLEATRARTGGFVGQRSEHFEVFTHDGPDRMLAPFILETLERGLAALEMDLGIEMPDAILPIRVEVYPSIDDFTDVSTLTAQEVKTSGTVALCKFHRLMIVSPRRLARGYRWRDTLNHELVHFVLSRGTNNQLPLWLHEGIAKFEERRWRSPRLGDLHPIQQSILAEARDRDVYVPFEEMMPSLAKLDSGWKTSLAFAEVTLLVRQVVEEGGLPRLQRVIRAFTEGRDEGFEMLGVRDEHHLWDRFEERLRSVPLDPVPGYRFIPPGVSEDPDEAEPEPIEKASARKYSRIGDLLRDEGRWAAAVTEYNKARRLLGHTPGPLSLRLAQAWMVGGRYIEAGEELEELVRRDPDRATAHWLRGKIALFRQDAESALEHYETAFAIAPFTDQVMDGLIRAAEAAGDTENLERYTEAREIWHAERNRP